jgi:hypothetical protein
VHPGLWRTVHRALRGDCARGKHNGQGAKPKSNDSGLRYKCAASSDETRKAQSRRFNTQLGTHARGDMGAGEGEKKERRSENMKSTPNTGACTTSQPCKGLQLRLELGNVVTGEGEW